MRGSGASACVAKAEALSGNRRVGGELQEHAISGGCVVRCCRHVAREAACRQAGHLGRVCAAVVLEVEALFGVKRVK